MAKHQERSETDHDESPKASAVEAAKTVARESGGSVSVEALAAAFAAAMKSHGPTAGLMTGMSEERLERVQGKLDRPLKFRAIAGRSPDTGATFTMIVLESRRFPNGRVARLENYRRPKEAYLPQSQGGLMPDGQQIWLDPKNQMALGDDTPSHMLNRFFKQWLYETFWQADLRRMAGHALRPEWCMRADGLDTPWEDSRVFVETSAEPEGVS